ncbi:MAG: hypothetical protein SO085_03375 [Eubacteriales bacterium]|nr:hypothetical protein [Eubacteriales bacterium]
MFSAVVVIICSLIIFFFIKRKVGLLIFSLCAVVFSLFFGLF